MRLVFQTFDVFPSHSAKRFWGYAKIGTNFDNHTFDNYTDLILKNLNQFKGGFSNIFQFWA